MECLAETVRVRPIVFQYFEQIYEQIFSVNDVPKIIHSKEGTDSPTKLSKNFQENYAINPKIL